MLSQYRDVFRSFHDHQVKYVVIGGVAAIAHGVPRTTYDLDILIEATHDNARRLIDALIAVRYGTATMITPESVLAHEITILKDRLRIDIQTRTPGLRFVTAWKNRTTQHNRGVPVQLASLGDLLRSKRKARRSIDLEDVRILTGGARPPKPAREP